MAQIDTKDEIKLRHRESDGGSGQGAETRGAPPTIIPEYEYSLRDHAVTFGQLVRARRAGRYDPNDSTGRSQVHAEYYPRLLKEFKVTNGAVEELYFGKNIESGACLTDRMKDPWEAARHRGLVSTWWTRLRKKLGGAGRGEQTVAIHLRYPPESVSSVTPEFQQVLWRCISLSRMGDELLRPESSRTLLRRTYSIMINLLSVLDAQAKVPEGSGTKTDRILEAIKTANSELVEARKQYIASAHWDSQLAYFKGMVRGLSVLTVALALALGFRRSIAIPDLIELCVCWGAGGVGAVVSVMSRLSSDRFKINYDAEHGALRLLGFFRPLIGAIFGTALFVLLQGGLLSIPSTSPETLDNIYFLAGIAFLAGFSERFAPDAFAETAKVSQPTGEAAPPGAGLAAPTASELGATSSRTETNEQASTRG